MKFDIQRANLEYVEDLYGVYKKDPEKLDESWRAFFTGVDFNQNLDGGLSAKELDIYHLIQAYRDYGHFEAKINPLGGDRSEKALALSQFNLNEGDLDKKFSVGALVGMEGASLRDIITHLKSCYCGTLSVQVSDGTKEVRQWFYNEIEKNSFQLSSEQKKEIFKQLCQTEVLEKFLHTRFVGAKRFSIEGGDSLIVQLEYLTEKAVELGVEDIVIGMAHRGRVNVLVNFMDKAVEQTLFSFDGQTHGNDDFDGDVKYHLGYSADKKTKKGVCHVSLAFNPSHLEAVNPVACGMVRAKQRRYEKRKNGKLDTSVDGEFCKRKKVVPVQIHGDAAFAGQGVVSETLQLSGLKGYAVGGSVHIIIDNQVGFTTSPEDTRSSPYASDVAKSQQVPVIHVNGDDPEACVRAMDMAIRFRQEFARDVLINLTCYRRFGHNEGDEPSYTQPVMYKTIKKHSTTKEIYAAKIIKEGVIDGVFKKNYEREQMDRLQKVLEKVREKKPEPDVQVFGGLWKDLRRSKNEDFYKTWDTTVSMETLKKVTHSLVTMPENFQLHPKLKKLIENRKKMAEGQVSLDWGMAELLAYGSLISEGTPIRLSGQDSIRGTFSHRHACFFDYITGERYSPLGTLREDTEFCVYNSPLSEMAVLGFEYGNSSSDPTFLTIWEAQFGDFANGAQIIIDQFLATGEQKWMRMSGLVLLLPHGYEGQGPEHSSARLERFLQLCAQKNMQVCNLTTPDQFFHALRRQMKRPFRLPLVVMSPKSLLRHPKAVCDLKNLSEGCFKEVLGDQSVDMEKVEKMVFLSGKLYYDLLAKRESLSEGDRGKVALVRVEQLYPYPGEQVLSVLKQAGNCQLLIWAQEEPKNKGGWFHMRYHLGETIKQAGFSGSLEYIGRGFRASPATGSKPVHENEQKQIVEKVFSMKKEGNYGN